MNIYKKYLLRWNHQHNTTLWLVFLALAGSTGNAQAAAIDSDILVNHDRSVKVWENGTYVYKQLTEGPAGGTFIYSGKIKLNSGAAVDNATLYMELPAGAIYKGYSTNATGASCTGMPTVGTAVPVNNKITCTIGTISLTDFKTIDFEVVIPSVNTNWKAYAYGAIGTDVNDANPSNNEKSEQLARNFTTSDATDFGINVTSDVTGAIATGNTYNYTIDVNSYGPTTITSGGRAEVTFQVPAGASLTSTPTGTNWSCTPAGNQPPNTLITCTYAGPIALESSGTPKALSSITVPVVAQMGGDIGFAANVRSFKDASTEMPDGQLQNNSAAVTVTVTGSAYTDVGLSKSVSPQYADALPGQTTPVTYTLTPKWLGGALAPAGIVVTDTLPTGVSFVAFDSTNDNKWACSQNTGTISCTWNGAAAWTGTVGSALPAIKFKANITGGAGIASGQTVSNTANVTVTTAEPNTTNNQASATVTYNNQADLQLTKSGPDRPVEKGKPFNYILTVKNNGPMAILSGQKITLTDTPTGGIKLLSKVSGDNWVCNNGSPFPGTANTAITCIYTAPPAGLANQASTTLELSAQVDDGDYSAGFVKVNNSALGTGPGERGSVATNTATISTTVSDQTAGLTIAKTVVNQQTPYRSGDEVTYQISVTNSGPKSAKQLRITDALHNLVIQKDGMTTDEYSKVGQAGGPANYVYPDGGFVSARITSGGAGGDSCVADKGVNDRNRTVTCNIAELAKDSTAVVELKIKPRVADQNNDVPATQYEYKNTAKASSAVIAGNEPTADATIQLTSYTDLTVVKTATPAAQVAAGEPVVYTVTVQNLGTSSAYKVKLEDVLPANAVMIKLDKNGGATCTNDGAPPAGKQGGTMICQWGGNLAAGAQYVVQYSMRSKGGNPGANEVLKNTAKVSTLTPERRLDNNEDEVEVSLKPAQLDVQIDMQHTKDGLALSNNPADRETEYTLTVTNSSASDSYATNVKITDIFPAVGSTATFSWQDGLAITGNGSGVKSGYISGVAGASLSGICQAANGGKTPALHSTQGPLECVIPLMAPGDVVTIKFKMRADDLPPGRDVGTIRHQATVKPAETEYLVSGADVLANNSTGDITSTSRIQVDTDLGIDKTGSATRAQAGDTIIYTLTVTNLGSLPITASTVTDTLPAGVSFISADAAGCSHAAGVVTCSVGNLAAGSHKRFNITTTVDANYQGTPLVNKACVQPASGTDQVPANDCAEFGINQPPPAASIPTMGAWATLLMSGLLAAFGLMRLPRRGIVQP